MHFLWGEETAIEKIHFSLDKCFVYKKLIGNKPVSESSHYTESDFACKT